MDFPPLRDSRWLAQQKPQKKSQVAVGRATALIKAAYKNIAVHSFRHHFRRTHGVARPQIEIDLRQIASCGIPIEPALNRASEKEANSKGPLRSDAQSVWICCLR